MKRKKKVKLPTVQQRLKQLEATVDMLLAIEMGRLMGTVRESRSVTPKLEWVGVQEPSIADQWEDVRKKAKRRRKTK